MSSTPDLLTGEAAELLRRIDSGDVLGATRQLGLLGDCLTSMARSRAPDAALRTASISLVNHIARSRGESSQAVINGLRLMAAPALATSQKDGPGTDGQVAGDIEASVAAFLASLQIWMADVRVHAGQLLSAYGTFLAYDYSSTVSHLLTDLAKAGVSLTVFLPEARSLGGGTKYLPDWQKLGITAHLIPDAALGWALSQCDVALAGAETLSAEGGCYNTIGTAVTAHEAHRRGVPFYILSVLLKTDLRTLGGERPIPTLDFTSGDLFAAPPAVPGIEVRGTFPDLDYTPPAVIAGIVTEVGNLTPGQVAAAAGPLVGDGA